MTVKLFYLLFYRSLMLNYKVHLGAYSIAGEIYAN